MNKRVLLIGLVVLLQTLAATAQRRAAPPGFTWQEIPELNTAVLKPEGWFFRQEPQPGVLAYFVSKEDIAKSGMFQTGLTMFVSQVNTGSASDRAKQIVEDLMAANPGGEGWQRSDNIFQTFSCRVRVNDESGAIIMFNLAVANSNTNRLYLLIFESPASEWESAWNLGKIILDNFGFDDRI